MRVCVGRGDDEADDDGGVDALVRADDDVGGTLDDVGVTTGVDVHRPGGRRRARHRGEDDRDERGQERPVPQLSIRRSVEYGRLLGRSAGSARNCDHIARHAELPVRLPHDCA